MSIHIHLFDCNCIFVGSDFPLDFFQSHNEDGPITQSATVPQDDSDLDDENDDWDDDEDEDGEDDDDSDDDENDGDHEGDDETDKPKPNKPGDKKRLFGFLIGKHDVCAL